MTFLYSCITLKPHQRSYDALPETARQQLAQKGSITMDSTQLVIEELGKSGIDQLKSNGKKKVFFILSGWCDSPTFDNLKSFDSLHTLKGFEKYFVSVGYEQIVMYHAAHSLHSKPQKIYVLSNKDFGTQTWGKPTNFLEYTLQRKIHKSKEVSSLMWLALDEQGKLLHFSGADGNFQQLKAAIQPL
jgi:hypothetical protein